MASAPSANSHSKRGRRRWSRQRRDHQVAWLWLLLLLVLSMLVAILGVSCGRQAAAASQVPASTVKRTPLDSGRVRPTGYITDRGDWLEENRPRAEKGLTYFYEMSGVQPHVYWRKAGTAAGNSREEMDRLASGLYGTLFSDEGHFLLLVEEGADGSLAWGMAVGNSAAAVMDEEARGIVAAYWELGMASAKDMTGREKALALGEIFTRSANNIMMVKNTAGWLWFFIGLVVLLLGLAAVSFRRNWRRLELEEGAERGNRAPRQISGERT